jgi:hypothetical protein
MSLFCRYISGGSPTQSLLPGPGFTRPERLGRAVTRGWTKRQGILRISTIVYDVSLAFNEVFFWEIEYKLTSQTLYS